MENKSLLEDRFCEDGQMITVSGRIIDLFDPKPEDFDINDIAHGLSNTCRWNGHTGEFFSVAQHCVLGLEVCPDNRKAQWLLHDAEEAYFGDIITPIKNLLPDIEQASERLRRVIYKQFGVEYLYDDIVREVDKRMLNWDYKHLIGDNYNRGVGWRPELAKKMFLENFHKYCK